jgi:hypothetical protein
LFADRFLLGGRRGHPLQHLLPAVRQCRIRALGHPGPLPSPSREQNHGGSGQEIGQGKVQKWKTKCEWPAANEVGDDEEWIGEGQLRKWSENYSFENQLSNKT